MAKRRRRAGAGDPAAAPGAGAAQTRQLSLPLDDAAMGRPDVPDLRALNRKPALAAASVRARAAAEEGDAAPMAPRPPRVSRPRDARPSVRQRVDELRAALEEGWEIVQPIFARPLWSVADDTSTAFSFVLRREHDTRLLTVPEGRLVRRFIRDHHLVVDDRR